ncbi:beta-ketoacyl-ACP synthase III [Deinococcus sp. SL84]|uniref:beta-ketoacyl-ACP synthase III n=1 Tax=Deinococcus sp. SL84 TaxID=2994663 RepID=UPI002276571F|nr:beta-ketoacyl-ACP synthase III [Deinococcus sp. SL84]MCY1703056.1 ketoacyl-ACP synthase III [Deinococcus sp. SL84]
MTTHSPRSAHLHPGDSGIGITALGMHVPERVVPNTFYETYLDTTAEWIESRTGMRERRYAAEDEYASHMGVKAVQDLLAHDPDALRDVDLILCATGTPDALFPSTAALIGEQVGLRGVAAADISVACSGFVYGLAMAKGQIAAGIARRVLVIGTEVLSKRVDQQERNNAILFADGAGAAVVGPVPEGYGLGQFVMGADGSGGGSLYMPGAAPALPDGTPMGEYAGMNGREVFKFAVRVIPESGQQVLQKSGLTIDDISWIIPHQANIRIIEAAAERFGVSMDKFVVNLDKYGNTSAATVPLAVVDAVRDGRIQDGQNILMVAFGGGLSWAACTLKWWAGAPSLRADAGKEQG